MAPSSDTAQSPSALITRLVPAPTTSRGSEVLLPSCGNVAESEDSGMDTTQPACNMSTGKLGRQQRLVHLNIDGL